MKLNNKGWGTTQMFLLSGGLLIALLVVVYLIGVMYGSLDNAVYNKNYIDIETKLEMAARNYINDNFINVDSEIVVRFDFLNGAGYIDKLNDKNGKPCDGYVTITNVDNINHYSSFISCKNYQTNGY